MRLNQYEENDKKKKGIALKASCRSNLHDESRLIQRVLTITKMMTKNSKVKNTS